MQNTVQIAVEFPVEALSALRTTHAEFAAELKNAAVCKWYEGGVISQSKGAFMLGISRSEFMVLLGRFGVSPYQTSVSELEELQAVREAGLRMDGALFDRALLLAGESPC